MPILIKWLLLQFGARRLLLQDQSGLRWINQGRQNVYALPPWVDLRTHPGSSSCNQTRLQESFVNIKPVLFFALIILMMHWSIFCTLQISCRLLLFFVRFHNKVINTLPHNPVSFSSSSSSWCEASLRPLLVLLLPLLFWPNEAPCRGLMLSSQSGSTKYGNRQFTSFNVVLNKLHNPSPRHKIVHFTPWKTFKTQLKGYLTPPPAPSHTHTYIYFFFGFFCLFVLFVDISLVDICRFVDIFVAWKWLDLQQELSRVWAGRRRMTPCADLCFHLVAACRQYLRPDSRSLHHSSLH